MANCSDSDNPTCTEQPEIITNEVDGVLSEGTARQISDNICEPIKNISQFWKCIENPPSWTRSIFPLLPRSNFVVKNSKFDCHYEKDSFLPRVRYDSRIVPRTLICHDMKNGYQEDRYIGSMKVGNGYTFYHWAQIDTFVYFSHHFVTIPPLAWINIAHNNGVKILGTFITEWEEGLKICDEIFRDEYTTKSFADGLVELCLLFKIDGWLINIENKIQKIHNLKLFVKYLTEELHKRIPGGLIIWYDSVTKDGNLAWQNELNEYNRCFFDSCDGIFLNYTWREENLTRSVKAAQHRYLDVYVGVDVFGRNTFGGGRFNVHVAAEVVRKHNLSIAIFAQGWTHETLPKSPQDTVLERFFDRNNAFWASIWEFLYTHPINKIFETFFYTGVDKTWYNLHNQDIQLTKILQPKSIDSEYATVPTLVDSCNCIQLHFEDNNTSCLLTKKESTDNKPSVHHLFTCDIPVKGKTIIYTITKKLEGIRCGDFNLVVLTQCQSGRFKKYLCYFNEHKLSNSACVKTVKVNPTNDDTVVHRIAHPFKDDLITIRSYTINFEESRILEIGAEIDGYEVACLSGFGIMKVQPYN